MFGIQNFVACNSEYMAHVAVNVPSFKRWKADKYPTTGDSSYPKNARWHIYDYATDTEREVQGINAYNYCIGRVRFGRFMDVIPSKCTSDNSAWNKNYSDTFFYEDTKCRMVKRASYNGYAYGGLVYADARFASSLSDGGCGSRLAFSGTIVFDDDEE